MPLATNTLPGDLAPATRCRAKVNDTHARLDQPELVIDFDQLVAGARSITLLPGTSDEFILLMIP
jgi:hypothetical protein